MADEKKLLERLKDRERDSIDDAIKIYTPYLGTVLYNMAGSGLSKEDAEEIVSDVFVMLWKNADYIDLKKGTIRSYIAAAARNFALRRLSKKTDSACIDDMELAADAYSCEQVCEHDGLWKAVMSLGEPDSEIFVRYYKFDEKLKDISKSMGINISTIKTKLSRGKQKLKRILSNAEEML